MDEQVDSLEDIRGFRININELSDDVDNKQQQQSIQNLFSHSYSLSKEKREYKIEGLSLNKKYAICVSVLRYLGYDKYCRDIEIIQDEQDAQDQATLVLNQHANANSSLTTIMITILSLLGTFVLGLIVFLYIYLNKCTRRRKSTTDTVNLSNGSASLSANYLLTTASNTIKTIKTGGGGSGGGGCASDTSTVSSTLSSDGGGCGGGAGTLRHHNNKDLLLFSSSPNSQLCWQPQSTTSSSSSPTSFNFIQTSAAYLLPPPVQQQQQQQQQHEFYNNFLDNQLQNSMTTKRREQQQFIRNNTLLLCKQQQQQ
jgi:hypothetical protein